MAAKGLSKENLKNELIAHNIPLPSSGSKKEKYVELYEKYVSTNNVGGQSEFSSDDEATPRAKKRSILTTKEETMEHSSSQTLTVNGLNVSDLSDDDLRGELIKLNFQPGPIIEQTRVVYEQHLGRLLLGDVDGDSKSTGSAALELDYSDSEGEEDIQVLQNSLKAQYPRDGTPTTRAEVKKAEQRRTPVKRTVEANNTDVVETFSSETHEYNSPTARRSIRSNIPYKAIDPEILKSYKKERANHNRHDDVSKLASTVVEQVQEPTAPRKSRVITLILIILAIVAVVLAVLVYENMESDSKDVVSELPDPAESASSVPQ